MVTMSMTLPPKRLPLMDVPWVATPVPRLVRIPSVCVPFFHCLFFLVPDTVLSEDNYMDYGYDSCLTEFTLGQRTRALDQLATYRK